MILQYSVTTLFNDIYLLSDAARHQQRSLDKTVTEKWHHEWFE